MNLLGFYIEAARLDSNQHGASFTPLRSTMRAYQLGKPYGKGWPRRVWGIRLYWYFKDASCRALSIYYWSGKQSIPERQDHD